MDLLEKFGYCPVCGSSHFENDSPKSKKCSACGFEWDEPEQTETVCHQCGAEAEGEILYD